MTIQYSIGLYGILMYACRIHEMIICLNYITPSQSGTRTVFSVQVAFSILAVYLQCVDYCFVWISVTMYRLSLTH